MRRLLLTGASGFVGVNLIPLLRNASFEIKTMGLVREGDYRLDLSTTVPRLQENFDVVLHAAGKVHTVPKSEDENEIFFNINYRGTINLCRALDKSGIPKALVYISSVAVYGLDKGENITENYPLNGTTPYALSKIRAEQFLTDWCTYHNVKLSIIRPSVIAGPNPPGNLEAMINGIKTGKYFSIGGGNVRKSILMVQDIARLLPALIENGGIYNVCDSDHPSFRQLELLIAKQLKKRPPSSISLPIARGMALAGDLLGKRAPFNSQRLLKMTESLTFSNEKAKKILGWEPLSVLENFIIQ
ncbi:Nucleoside-diphosphate-sugar epimerase [Porphyromonadaceae bacterium KH3CP3RA]|nr:Nucleoside-diphosphate-sugar epimerase [Porphyromonadaceae bacterium KH3CP3RA]